MKSKLRAQRDTVNLPASEALFDMWSAYHTEPDQKHLQKDG